MRRFIDKCLATVSLRLSASELLNDAFLQVDNGEYDLRTVDYDSSFCNGYPYDYSFEASSESGYHPIDTETNGIELFEYCEGEHSDDVDISIKGKMREGGSIFLRLRIADKEGRFLIQILFISFRSNVESKPFVCRAYQEHLFPVRCRDGYSIECYEGNGCRAGYYRSRRNENC